VGTPDGKPAGPVVGQDGAVTGAADDYRLYADLAAWWPLISPPGEYQQEAAYLAALLAPAAPGPGPATVLDLGSGGGHMAVHLDRAGLALTLTDLSATMLATSRQLNPGLPHHQGDMRTIRLGQEFDAVLLHDAVDYMTTEADLAQAVATAYAHCRPGGLAVFVPDYTAETFELASGHGGGGSDATGRQASFREWATDPDASDDWIQVDYEFVLCDADGAEQVVTESHRLGAFSHAAWLRVIAAAGFTAGEGPPAGDGYPGQRPRNLFTGLR
jgi:SAM-dependent methyltransferase